MNLTGKLLISMPGIGDDTFDNTVVFLCSHTDEGAMGLIINKVTPDVSLGNLLSQLEIEASSKTKAQAVLYGGPVELQRGFVLHSRDYISKVKTLDVAPWVGMTATLDVLEDIGAGQGPEEALVMLGYAGWGPGQLEGEIAQNGWLTADATHDLVFDTPFDQRWGRALESIGVAALTLSSEAGHA